MENENIFDHMQEKYIIVSVPGRQNVPGGGNCQVRAVFEYVAEEQSYGADDTWWYIDQETGAVHILTQEKVAKEYMELTCAKLVYPDSFTHEMQDRLSSLEVMFDMLPKMAASKACAKYPELYSGMPVAEDADLADDGKKQNRTRKKAGTDIAEVPSKLPLITNRTWQNAMTYNDDETAYLQPLSSADGLTYENGRLMLGGNPATAARIKYLYTKDNIETFDLPLLRVFYAVILNRFAKTWMEDKSVDEVITIYYPDLAKQMGRGANLSRRDVEQTIKNILSFRNILGITEKGNNILPVLVYLGEDREKNTISFASPYMVKVIKDLSKASVRKNKQGLTVVNKKGIPVMQPAYTYIPDMSLAKEKNKKAVEIVCIVITTIEQAGDHGTPHISARTIIERNLLLKQSLDNASSAADKNKFLQRAFSKAWELLRTHTDIMERYKNIKLPDPQSKNFRTNYIPTMGTLDMVFEFPHEGKIRD